MKIVKNIIITIIIVGFVTAIVDYIRMSNTMMPMFCIKKYDEKTRVESFRGLFYVAYRTIREERSEPIKESNDMKFKLIVFDLKVPEKYNKELLNFKIETEEDGECSGQSELYYNGGDYKVYTYCLSSIKVVEYDQKKELVDVLEKEDIKIIDDIEYMLAYTGYYANTNTLFYQSRDLRENKFTNKGLRIYHCNLDNVKDVYIGPVNMEYQADFCTLKNDVDTTSNDSNINNTGNVVQ